MATAAIAPKTSPERVRAFRERHDLSAEEMDRLFGFSSKGRSTRRWEAEDAPPYVEVLMAYMDAHGIKLARDIAKGRESA